MHEKASSVDWESGQMSTAASVENAGVNSDQTGGAPCDRITALMSRVLPRSRLIVLAVLAAHAALLLDGAWKHFVAIDEAGHIVAGICHWETGDYSLYRVNPPLPRMIAVLPVLLARPETQGIQPSLVPGARAEFSSARQFTSDNAARYLTILRLARLAGIGWSLLGAWLVYRWASELYGRGAGMLGLFLWCCEPSILAHAQMATPDLPAAIAGLAATYAFWHYLRAPSWRGALFAGLLLGVAELTKFTWLILYGMWPLLWLLHWLAQSGDASRPLSWSRQLGHAVGGPGEPPGHQPRL